MAKKKQQQPAPDQHTSGKMIRLTEAYHKMLKEAARINNRPATWELRVALDKHFKDLGLEPPADSST